MVKHISDAPSDFQSKKLQLCLTLEACHGLWKEVWEVLGLKESRIHICYSKFFQSCIQEIELLTAFDTDW